MSRFESVECGIQGRRFPDYRGGSCDAASSAAGARAPTGRSMCCSARRWTAAEQQRLLASPGAGLWCLDPLDGTGNFAAGIPFFAVSLALICAGAVQAAVVYDPVRDECFSALRGQGAWLNGRPLIASQDRRRP